MDKGSCDHLMISRLPQGGYVVFRNGWDRGMDRDPLFATGDVEIALSFIRDQIVPVPAIQSAKAA